MYAWWSHKTYINLILIQTRLAAIVCVHGVSAAHSLHHLPTTAKPPPGGLPFHSNENHLVQLESGRDD